MNLPNTLTLLRIFFVPLLLAVMLSGEFDIRTEWGAVSSHDLALLIFLSASITDILDGYLARRRRQVTTLGKLLDPIADKLLISAAFISLVELGRAPAWAAVVIVGRDFAVSGLRAVAATRGVTIAANEWGKAKMVGQVVTVALLLVTPDYPALTWAAETALLLAVGLTAISMFEYFRRFWPLLEDAAEESRPPRLRSGVLVDGSRQPQRLRS